MLGKQEARGGHGRRANLGVYNKGAAAADGMAVKLKQIEKLLASSNGNVSAKELQSVIGGGREARRPSKKSADSGYSGRSGKSSTSKTRKVKSSSSRHSSKSRSSKK